MAWVYFSVVAKQVYHKPIWLDNKVSKFLICDSAQVQSDKLKILTAIKNRSHKEWIHIY